MSKDPSPKADGLRAMREETRGHLQATMSPPFTTKLHSYVDGAKPSTPVRKLIPFAGKDKSDAKQGGGIPYSKTPKPTAKKGKKR